MCCTYSQALYQLTIEQIFRMKIHYTVCIRLQTFGGDGGAYVRRLKASSDFNKIVFKIKKINLKLSFIMIQRIKNQTKNLKYNWMFTI